MNPTTTYAVPQVGERVEFVEDYAPHAALGQRGVVTAVEDPEDGGMALITVHLDADEEPTVPAFAHRLKVVPAEDTLAEAPTYEVGDLVTVISDHPTFRVNFGGPCPSSAKKGETYRVGLVWRDGDLTLAEPESGEEGSIVVSPEFVEPYIAPAIFIASTARQTGKTVLSEAWRDLGYVPADGFATFDEAVDLTDWQTAILNAWSAYRVPQRFILGMPRSNGWATVQEGLARAQAIIDEGLAEDDEPDDMDRRADALEEAIDLLGDDRLVEDYVAAARFILGEEA